MSCSVLSALPEKCYQESLAASITRTLNTIYTYSTYTHTCMYVYILHKLHLHYSHFSKKKKKKIISFAFLAQDKHQLLTSLKHLRCQLKKQKQITSHLNVETTGFLGSL